MFVDKLLGLLSGIAKFLGDMIYAGFKFLERPLALVYYFFDGVFYFVAQVAIVIYKIISLFVALVQLFVALVAGFLRTVGSFVAVDFSKTPISYPSSSRVGVDWVVELLQPTGLLTVLPMIALALLWFFFVKRMIGLIGGGGQA